ARPPAAATALARYSLEVTVVLASPLLFYLFSSNAPSPTETYTLSLHDALPISDRAFRIGQTRNVQVHKFVCGGTVEEKIDALIEDRKSTRLNSSHVAISYAVFCLKKKKKKISKKYNKTTKKENAKKISRHNKTK